MNGEPKWWQRAWPKRQVVEATLRGRVHKVSIIAGGEVSVVVRFGVEEPEARALNQGALLGVVTIAEGKLSAALAKHESSDSKGPQ